jgi:hypothetical protein
MNVGQKVRKLKGLTVAWLLKSACRQVAKPTTEQTGLGLEILAPRLA